MAQEGLGALYWWDAEPEEEDAVDAAMEDEQGGT